VADDLAELPAGKVEIVGFVADSSAALNADAQESQQKFV
jgi:hypothetical protein